MGTDMMNQLYMEMIRYYSGDAKRIQHFVKVHAFAKLISELEHVDDRTKEIIETAALVHDIGIRPAEEKYGTSSGKLQEQEGPAAAQAMLTRLGTDERLTDRVCYLVGHHHTYTDIDGIDYQILVEADFLVNLYEDQSGDNAVVSAMKNIFKTESGKQICREMFRTEGESNG